MAAGARDGALSDGAALNPIICTKTEESDRKGGNGIEAFKLPLVRVK